jgi:hypothetical protein
MSFSWLFRDPFQRHFHSGLFRLSPFRSRLFDTSHKFVPAFGWKHVFDPDIDPFGDDPVSDPFVDDHTDCMRSDVKDSSSSAVIIFVRHPLLKGPVSFNVYQISPFVHPQVSGQVFHSPATEVP